MKIEIAQTDVFQKWFEAQSDDLLKKRIIDRLDRVAVGNFGDHKSLGNNLWELRFHFGGGLRIYYLRCADSVVILLCGGDKDRQSRDIEKAKQLANEIQNEQN